MLPHKIGDAIHTCFAQSGILLRCHLLPLDSHQSLFFLPLTTFSIALSIHFRSLRSLLLPPDLLHSKNTLVHQNIVNSHRLLVMTLLRNSQIRARTVATPLNLKSIYPPFIPRISYKVVKMVIVLSWTKLPFRFSQNWFLLKLLALKCCTFQGLKLTYDILVNRISNIIDGIYGVFWDILDHMFSFSQKFKFE